MLVLPNTGTYLRARALETRPTRATNAWEGLYLTVELYAPLQAIRVHHSRSALLGDWFAIGDCVLTSGEYTASRALPGPFRYIADCVLLPGTILNVGRCARLFTQPGGGEQAEFLEGPLPRMRVLDATWSNVWGNA